MKNKFKYKRKYKKYKNNLSSRIKRLEKQQKIDRKSIEIKKYDVTNSGTQYDWSNVNSHILNDISQGTSVAQRIGNKIILKGLKLCITLSNTNDPLLTTASSGHRVIVVFDKESTAPSLTNILQNTNSVLTILSDYKKDNRDDYIILYDKIFNVDSVNRKEFNKKIFINLKNKLTAFDTGASTIETGRLLLFFVNNLDSTASNKCVYRFYSRVTYTDS